MYATLISIMSVQFEDCESMITPQLSCENLYRYVKPSKDTSWKPLRLTFRSNPVGVLASASIQIAELQIVPLNTISNLKLSVYTLFSLLQITFATY